MGIKEKIKVKKICHNHNIQSSYCIIPYFTILNMGKNDQWE